MGANAARRLVTLRESPHKGQQMSDVQQDLINEANLLLGKAAAMADSPGAEVAIADITGLAQAKATLALVHATRSLENTLMQAANLLS
jgi:hypothetical protein